MHHHERVLHIDWVAGRDVREDDLARIHSGLENWSVPRGPSPRDSRLTHQVLHCHVSTDSALGADKRYPIADSYGARTAVRIQRPEKYLSLHVDGRADELKVLYTFLPDLEIRRSRKEQSE